jgi:hypothetical protein
MIIRLLILALFWSSAALADVVNVEFKFTPYIGDAATAKQVETVPGKAKVFINNVIWLSRKFVKITFRCCLRNVK